MVLRPQTGEVKSMIERESTCTLRVYPFQERVTFTPGESVSEILHRAGLGLDSPCGGQGVCGQCLIVVHDPGHVPQTPHEALSEQDMEQGYRLACQLRPQTALTITILESGRSDHRSEGAALSEPDKYVSSGDIAPAARVGRTADSLIYTYEGIQDSFTCFEHTDCSGLYGLALDLGTTTLAASLVCLESGAQLGTLSALNPQVQFGQDVLTRIKHAGDLKGRQELMDCIREGINALARDVCAKAKALPTEIVDIVVGGNTTMLQICAGIDPSPLGQLPFRVDLKGGRSYPAQEFGLTAHAFARVYIPPIAHAFVGTDVSAGLGAACDFFTPGAAHLYIDVGTNGEMGLSMGGMQMLTSTAAGPAFEGAGLTCGMRAAEGAVERVDFHGEDIAVQTIADVPEPLGICGSGFIDLMHVLVDIGVIDPSGRMKKPEEGDDLPDKVAKRLLLRDGKPAFSLAEGVLFTQGDVRKLQLAKAAIRAGMECLLHEAGVSAADLDKISIAGGFGRFLRPPSLQAIGMVPPDTAAKIEFVGNTSRLGCIRLLLDCSRRERLETDMASVKYLAIAEQPAFMDRFVECIPFPQPDAAKALRN